jgi:hypothetical protein
MKNVTMNVNEQRIIRAITDLLFEGKAIRGHFNLLGDQLAQEVLNTIPYILDGMMTGAERAVAITELNRMADTAEISMSAGDTNMIVDSFQRSASVKRMGV